MRSESELRACIENIEAIYPPGKMVWGDPIGNYNLGILAGIKVALGDYPSFVEMDMEEFIKLTFPSSDDNAELLLRCRMFRTWSRT